MLRWIATLAAVAAVALVGLAPVAARAHGLIGTRFFPATLGIDDPFVADELSLPTISHIKTRGEGDAPPARETDFSAELSKRLTPDLGFSLGGTYRVIDPDTGPVVNGFDNMEVSLKYVLFKDAEHETLLSLGLGWDVGGTGMKKVGAESFDTVTPALFFGKGLGDLPDALELARPLALTGSVGVAMPTRHANVTRVVEDDGSVSFDREVNPSVARWGFTLQYNLQYLQSNVRDVGLPPPFSRMIPIVEFVMQTPLDDPRSAGRTTGTIQPGIIWFGRYIQLGLEAVIPVNERSGKNVGIVGQLHFYLDDILPKVFTWTPFHGVLGPTQGR
ncbi:MAG TPA: hypothetical protein VFL90_09520 [Methylomirabilota bacterium]|nr:hypothetical protein [Methylomirabilota bacterium]